MWITLNATSSEQTTDFSESMPFSPRRPFPLSRLLMSLKILLRFHVSSEDTFTSRISISLKKNANRYKDENKIASFCQQEHILNTRYTYFHTAQK